MQGAVRWPTSATSGWIGNLALAFQAQGTLKDIGGQAVYQNLRNRWNWGGGVARVPYLRFFADYARDEDGNLV